MEAITKKTFSDLENEVPVEIKSEVIFRAETFLDKNPRKVFDEEFIHTLNQFKNLIIRQELTEERKRLEELEKLNDKENIAVTIDHIAILQKSLQAKPYDTDLLKE